MQQVCFAEKRREGGYMYSFYSCTVVGGPYRHCRLFRQQLYMTCDGPYQTTSFIADRGKADRGKAYCSLLLKNSCFLRTWIDEGPTVGLRVSGSWIDETS